MNIPAGALTSPWRQTCAHGVREEDGDEPSGVKSSQCHMTVVVSLNCPYLHLALKHRHRFIFGTIQEELHLRMTASYSGDVHSHTFMHFAGIFILSDGGFKGDWSKLSHLYSTEYLFSGYYWGMFS